MVSVTDKRALTICIHTFHVMLSTALRSCVLTGLDSNMPDVFAAYSLMRCFKSPCCSLSCLISLTLNVQDKIALFLATAVRLNHGSAPTQMLSYCEVLEQWLTVDK